MKVVATALSEVLLLEPDVYRDERGYFYESYNEARLLNEAGIDCRFVQDNHSHSRRHVLRGLHYQVVHPQAKLVRCLAGEVLDIAVDLRRGSPTFGKWVSFILSETACQVAWIPAGFAHGFHVRSESADVFYKTSDYYRPEFDRCIAWDDPILAIDWQLDRAPILSKKDSRGTRFVEADTYG